jgi:hypothetical protein
MQTPSFQTVKLAKGRHWSPSEGVCIMELASMLAGERFSDRPRAVSRSIGGLLRAYNDLIDDGLRQDLLQLASDLVGSAGSPELEERRAQRVVQWGEQVQDDRTWNPLAVWARRPCLIGGRLDPDDAGRFAVRAIGRKPGARHYELLALVRELIAMGDEARTAVPAGSPARTLQPLTRA